YAEVLARLGGGVALAEEPAPGGIAVVEADLHRLAEHADQPPAIGLAFHDPALLGRREVSPELDRDAAGHHREHHEKERDSDRAHGAHYGSGADIRQQLAGRASGNVKRKVDPRPSSLSTLLPVRPIARPAGDRLGETREWPRASRTLGPPRGRGARARASHPPP